MEQKDTDVIDKNDTKEPQNVKVVVHNDDFTPITFVMTILMMIFKKTEEESSQIAQSAHANGKCICGEYTPEVAETKVYQSMNLAKRYEHPFLVTIES